MSTDNNTGDEALQERLLRAMHRNGDWMTVDQILAFVKAEFSRIGMEIAELQALEMNHEGECVRLKRENDELRAQLAAIESARAKDAAELEQMRAEHQELQDHFITNAQRLGSVCDNWHNWAVEIVGKEAARKMSGQDMRDEIARRLAGRTTDQAEPRKRRGPCPDGPPKAGDPQDADKDGAR